MLCQHYIERQRNSERLAKLRSGGALPLDVAAQHRRNAERLAKAAGQAVGTLATERQLIERFHRMMAAEGRPSTGGRLVRRSAASFATVFHTTPAFKLITRSQSRLSRSAGPGDQVVVSGLAVPYNILSMDLGGYRELYQPGCFAASLGNDLALLFNHDPSLVLGRASAGTAIFYEQPYEQPDGIHVDGCPPNVQWARDLVTSMRRGDIRQMSAAFRIDKARGETRNGEKICVIERGTLFECSIVSMAAYGSATDVAIVDEDALDSKFLAGIGIQA